MRTWRSPIPTKYLWIPLLLGTVSVFAALFSGCADSSQLGYPLYVPGRDYIAVDGGFGFISQCPYGSMSSPEYVRGGLWACPLGADSVQLSTPPPELILQADCRKRLLTVRKVDRTLDSTWEVSPDGSFDIFFDFSAPIVLSRDQRNAGPCQAQATLELSGKLDCADPDKVVFQVDTHWNLSSPTQATGRPLCQLPSGCYLHATAQIKQCN